MHSDIAVGFFRSWARQLWMSGDHTGTKRAFPVLTQLLARRLQAANGVRFCMHQKVYGTRPRAPKKRYYSVLSNLINQRFLRPFQGTEEVQTTTVPFRFLDSIGSFLDEFQGLKHTNFSNTYPMRVLPCLFILLRSWMSAGTNIFIASGIWVLSTLSNQRFLGPVKLPTTLTVRDCARPNVSNHEAKSYLQKVTIKHI